MFGVVQPQYRPCGECGASVPVSEEDTHECDRQRWLDYQMFQHRGGVAQLEVELGVSLETPHGRFACSTRNDNDEGRPGWISARS
jgi:hypothetical protein